LAFDVTGLDSQAEMLETAKKRLLEAPPKVRERLRLIQGDMRTWQSESAFDLIVIPCSSISHLLTLQDQLTVWNQCRRNLRPGGRFVVEITMPNMATFADSFNVPPRALVEIDVDKSDESDGVRFIRRKTSRYLSHEQCAQTRFLYEKYQNGRAIDGYIDDFAGHVFFPRELQLLFIHTGFEVEQTLGDYRGRPLKPNSPLIIMIGKLAAMTSRTTARAAIEEQRGSADACPRRERERSSRARATPAVTRGAVSTVVGGGGRWVCGNPDGSIVFAGSDDTLVGRTEPEREAERL